MNDLELVARLQQAAATAAGLRKVEELFPRGKGSHEIYICKFRDAAIFLARQHTELSVIRLGELFGGRDPSTITAACRREAVRLTRNAPRKDHKTHAEWHTSLLDAARSSEETNAERG